MSDDRPDPLVPPKVVMSQAEQLARTWDVYQNAVMWGDMEDAEWWWHRMHKMFKEQEKRECFGGGS